MKRLGSTGSGRREEIGVAAARPGVFLVACVSRSG